VEGLIKEIKDFYKMHEMGELVVFSLHPVTLIIRDEYDCSKAPDVGKTLCLLNEGILEAIFEERLHMPLRVVEKDTFGVGFNMCKYVIEPSL
jgi:predicted hydrocarbon binding protein